MFSAFQILPDELELISVTSNAFHSPWIVLDYAVPVVFMLLKLKGERELKLVFSTDGTGGCLPPRTQQVRWMRVLMPPAMTGSNVWRLERIHELWEVLDANTGMSGRLFIAAGGEFTDIVTGLGPPRPEHLQKGRRIFPVRY